MENHWKTAGGQLEVPEEQGSVRTETEGVTLATRNPVSCPSILL